MRSLCAFFIPLLAVASVSAHGYMNQMTIDGKDFKGPKPGDGGKGEDSIIRKITTGFPIKGAGNKDINCGPGSKPAALVADANPGSKLDISWIGDDGNNFVHFSGPMFTFMASCGDVSCDKFNSDDAKWFKIDEVGKKPGSDEWFLKDISEGKSVPVTIPSHIKSGNYLLMHTILATHLATQENGAEFYSGCAQLKIGGSETGVPKEDELDTFPGSIKDSDPGVFNTKIFDPGFKYPFPGKPVVSFADNASPSDNDPKKDDPTKDEPKQTPTPEDDHSSNSGSPSPTSTSTDKGSPTKTKKPKKTNTKKPEKPKQTCTDKEDGKGDDDESKDSSSPTPTPNSDDRRRRDDIPNMIRALRRHHSRDFRAQIH